MLLLLLSLMLLLSLPVRRYQNFRPPPVMQAQNHEMLLTALRQSSTHIPAEGGTLEFHLTSHMLPRHVHRMSAVTSVGHLLGMSPSRKLVRLPLELPGCTEQTYPRPCRVGTHVAPGHCPLYPRAVLQLLPM